MKQVELISKVYLKNFGGKVWIASIEKSSKNRTCGHCGAIILCNSLSVLASLEGNPWPSKKFFCKTCVLDFLVPKMNLEKIVNSLQQKIDSITAYKTDLIEKQMLNIQGFSKALEKFKEEDENNSMFKIQ